MSTTSPLAVFSVLATLSPSKKLLVWLTLVFFTLTLGFLQWQSGAKIQTDILAMLPKVSEKPLEQRAIAQVEQQLANRLYIGVISADKNQAVSAASALMQQLKSNSTAVFTDISSADISQAEALNAFYFPYRFNLLTDKQQQQLTQNQWPQLTQASLQKLYSAFGYANSALISHDPLLLYPDNLLALAPKQALSVENAVLVTRLPSNDAKATPRYVAIVMAKGLQSVFSPNAQQSQLSALNTAQRAVSAEFAAVDFIHAGALFHAAAATDNAKKEVSSIGLISLIGVIALVWFAFRSIMPLMIAVITLSCSLLFAVVLTLVVFGELHLLTLVFGTSLIGIAIDYCFHFYCERLNHPQQDANRTSLAILPAISLALVTSIIAYGSLGLAPFPGMQQVAIFCAAGLIGAYLTLVFAYPKLAGAKLNDGQRLLEFADTYQGFMLKRAIPSSRLSTVILLLSTVAFIGVGLSQLKSDDDIRQLQHTPAAIQQQEDTLRTVLSGGTDNQFLLVSGQTEEQVKQALEQLEPILETAQQQQLLGNHFSLSKFLPSEKTQASNYQLQQQIYQQHLVEILNRLGIEDSIKQPLADEFTAAKNRYIHVEDFLQSPAGQQLSSMWLMPQQDSDCASIVLLGGIKQLDTLSALFSDNPNVDLVDKVGDISKVMGHYRQLTLALLVIALITAVSIFTFRFGVKLASIVVSVPGFAAILTLSTLGIMHAPLTLFHALALILVFGIGIDYSLFFAEANQKTRGVMMAVLMSAISTLLAFGLLAFSQTPAISAFGLTLLIGISFTFLLSPFIQIYTRKPSQC
ncbi:MMPL family transporter [Shewanella sp. GutDb-MelDb]|uniref:MMPL family transporter n=1 Tax=Shewanella sp. GutDb-MelDb TaxID=2058316 RepID=UPI000C797DB4|nr:MMPL family transporter [Shewanella sp. GutDb-MelDb]PKG55490.1 transporter permease [Shewanella sp. GutDb-MelDb]